MKKTVLALTTAFACGLISFAAPASAAPASPAPLAGVAADHTDVSSQRFRRKVCTVRTVVTRGPMGRRIVRKVRTCR